MAAAGTPDSATCTTGVLATTGANAGCFSNWGVNDMVGNLYEWVADWAPLSTACPGWVASFSNDFMCLSGASTTATTPGALVRGGDWTSGTKAGVFALDASASSGPSGSSEFVGFRCAR